MSHDDIRRVLARVQAGDRLRLTFKPGQGCDQLLSVGALAAVKYLAANADVPQIEKFECGIMDLLVRYERFGEDANRIIFLAVPEQFARWEFGDVVTPELQSLFILPPTTIKSRPVWIRWLIGAGLLVAALSWAILSK